MENRDAPETRRESAPHPQPFPQAMLPGYEYERRLISLQDKLETAKNHRTYLSAIWQHDAEQNPQSVDTRVRHRKTTEPSHWYLQPDVAPARRETAGPVMVMRPMTVPVFQEPQPQVVVPLAPPVPVQRYAPVASWVDQRQFTVPSAAYPEHFRPPVLPPPYMGPRDYVENQAVMQSEASNNLTFHQPQTWNPQQQYELRAPGVSKLSLRNQSQHYQVERGSDSSRQQELPKRTYHMPFPNSYQRLSNGWPPAVSNNMSQSSHQQPHQVHRIMTPCQAAPEQMPSYYRQSQPLETPAPPSYHRPSPPSMETSPPIYHRQIPSLETLDKGSLLARYSMPPAPIPMQAHVGTTRTVQNTPVHIYSTAPSAEPQSQAVTHHEYPQETHPQTTASEKEQPADVKPPENTGFLRRIFGGADEADFNTLNSVRLQVGMCSGCLVLLHKCEETERMLVAQCAHLSTMDEEMNEDSELRTKGGNDPSVESSEDLDDSSSMEESSSTVTNREGEIPGVGLLTGGNLAPREGMSSSVPDLNEAAMALITGNPSGNTSNNIAGLAPGDEAAPENESDVLPLPVTDIETRVLQSQVEATHPIAPVLEKPGMTRSSKPHHHNKRQNKKHRSSSNRSNRRSGSRNSRKKSSKHSASYLAVPPIKSEYDQILERSNQLPEEVFNPCRGHQFGFMDELQSGLSEMVPFVPDPKRTDTSGCDEAFSEGDTTTELSARPSKLKKRKHSRKS
ncbi:unnamed protein product [Notodromas monacha]|uniref:Uncharacterized protein n=1 Tax=Notodromas monacha TaxID=399045 RepID=A0A7R9G7T6_9CRUS|nr:unnamed protein product [Notodromas monacha]CAG0912411.1 unnamed protein product [Notodromas monacha]